jgi:hypothetical protein
VERIVSIKTTEKRKKYVIPVMVKIAIKKLLLQTESKGS